MNRLIKILLFFLFSDLIISCSSNEEIFTEDISIEIPVINLLELSESGFANVHMTGISSIEGFTRDHYFYSNDLLKNYNKTNGGIGFWDVVHKDNEVTTLFAYNGNNFELSIVDRTTSITPVYTTRFTLSAWETVIINPYRYNGFIDYKTADFISSAEGWIAADYERSSNGPDQELFPHGIRVYKVNGNSYSLISTIEGFRLESKSINFINEQNGYLLAYKGNNDQIGYIFETTDGGNSWEELYTFDKEPENLFVLEGSNLLIECADGYLQSNDGGVSWINIPTEKQILHTTIDKDGILYSLTNKGFDRYSTIGSLSISEDNGITWKQISGSDFYGRKISFFDRSNGIAYSTSILQSTSDGGQTWELLAFPIEL